MAAFKRGFSLVDDDDEQQASNTEELKRSFEANYREHYSLVFNYVRRRMPNREATEDVVSDAFLRAARYYSRFDPSRSKFSTWVISIARNCISDYYEKDVLLAPIDEVPEGVYADESDNNSGIDNKELAEKLLSMLDDEERELVFLKFYQEKRNTEIAEELGMNVSTVSTKLSRIMAKLRTAV